MASAQTTALQRTAGWIVRHAGAVRGVRAVAEHPLVVRSGFGVVTALATIWGGVLSTGRLERHDGLLVASGCPGWAFGRGGTTLGGVYLTSHNVSAAVLEHEAVHLRQWRRYGLAFALLYLAAGPVAQTNRFEVEAGLERGGYR